MGSKKIFILSIVYLVFLVSFVGAQSDYSLNYLARKYSSFGDTPWYALIQNNAVVGGADRTDITYSTSQGNWLPTDTLINQTESNLRLNVNGEHNQGGADPRSGFRVINRVYGQKMVRVQSRTWGNHGELKLDRVDTFQRDSDTSILINGNPRSINIGGTYQIQRFDWNPGDNGGGYSYLNIINVNSGYFEVEIVVWEYDEQWDSAYARISTYIEGLCDCLSGACCDGCNFRPSTTECRATAGACDTAEYCTGASAGCPVDTLVAAGTECRAEAGSCDIAETCTGANAFCPLDVFQPEIYECRATAGNCDTAEFCTGAIADCPADGPAAQGTPCGDCMECDGAGNCIASGNYIYKKGDHSNQYYIDWLDDSSDTACCSSGTNCVFNQACYAQGQYAVNLSSSVDNIAECGMSVWLDVDGDSPSCFGAGLEWMGAGESNVGEYADSLNGGDGVTECCGDDSGEYSITRSAGPDSIYPSLDSDKACCNSGADCVGGGACYATGSTIGTALNLAYCSDGVWGGGDDSSTACNTLTSGNNWYPGVNFESGQGDCCGDDSNEFYRTRLCGADVCVTDINDVACCDNAGSFDGDCVYGSNCYTYFEYGNCEGSDSTCMDVGDGSTDLEVCMGAGWIDPDNNGEACGEVNGHPRPTLWMPASKNPVCGLWETGQGNCNDVAPTVEPGEAGFCCGDDDGEFLKGGIDNICFADPNGCFLNGRYYENEEYSGDYYCQNGTMTSITKLIALQLLEIANQESAEDYTLFCDSYGNTLNYYSYSVGWDMASQYLKDINNICVLEMPDIELPNKVIFGVSLNKSIYDGIYPFIDVLVDAEAGIDCSDAIGIDDGQFHKCGGSYKVWYNSKIKGAIYSNKDIMSIGTIDFWDRFQLFLKSPFENIFNFLLQLIGEKGIPRPEDYNFINSAARFSRIYMDRKGVKSIKGVTEETIQPKAEYLSVTYGCYNSDICSTVDSVLGGRGRDLAICYYDKPTSTYYVASNSSEGLALWPELTARLRPQKVTSLPVQACMSTQSCEIRQGICLAGETTTPLLALSNPTDSHVTRGDVFDIKFNYKLCCPDYYAPDPFCSQAKAIQLSAREDAHASVYGVSPFSVNLCLKSTDPAQIASCRYTTAVNCNSDELCFVSLSDTADAHVSGCKDSQFGIKVCCNVLSGGGGGGGGGGGTPSTTLYISPSSQNRLVGSQFNINVRISDVNDLYSAPFYLTYDPTKLKVVNAQDGGFLQGLFFPEAVPDTDGSFIIGNSKIGSVAGVSGSGTLAIITLEAIASGTSQLGLINTNFVNSAGNPIILDVIGGSVTIS